MTFTNYMHITKLPTFTICMYIAYMYPEEVGHHHVRL